MERRFSWIVQEQGLLETIRALRRVSGEVETALQEAVRKARRAGHSWTEIGEALGMTKQSAWERFAGEEK